MQMYRKRKEGIYSYRDKSKTFKCYCIKKQLGLFGIYSLYWSTSPAYKLRKWKINIHEKKSKNAFTILGPRFLKFNNWRPRNDSRYVTLQNNIHVPVSYKLLQSGTSNYLTNQFMQHKTN